MCEIPVPSPCQGTCALDGATQTCTGCRRTMAEIVGWPTMGDPARRAVLARLAALPPAPPSDRPARG